MTIYNMYIFDKFGTLMYYAEWNRVKQSGITREEVRDLSDPENTFSFIKNLCFRTGGEANVWYVILYQIFCGQNLTDGSKRRLSVLQNQ